LAGSLGETRVAWRGPGGLAVLRGGEGLEWDAGLLRRRDELRAQGFGRTAVAKILSGETGIAITPDKVRHSPGWEGGERKEAERAPSIEERVQDTAKRLVEKDDRETLKRLLEDRAAVERIAQVIGEAAARAVFPPLEIAPPAQVGGDFPEEEAVLVISDVHIGELVDPEETGGLGGYNLEIYNERLAKLESAVREIAAIHRRAYPLRRLRVFFLGDMVDNQTIFRGQAHHIQVGVTEQVLIATRTLAASLVRLLDSFEEVRCVGIVGNHGRIGMKGEARTHDNWDRIVYEWMRDLTVNQPRITWQIPKAWWAIEEVLGWRFLVTHGDDIKSWNSIPYYGIDRADGRYTKLMAANQTPYHYFVVGHFHQAADLDAVGGEKIVNGAWPGASPFSLKVLQSASRPSQMFFGVTPKHGISWRYRVYLD